MACLTLTGHPNSMNEIIMEKLKMHSPNFVDQNIAKIAELFPNCVTESRNDKVIKQRLITKPESSGLVLMKVSEYRTL